MSGGRWKKLAIAAVVLTVGIVTAMLFRREETADQAFVPKKASPEVPAKSRARSDATLTNNEEAKLAGHIEPYSGGLERLASESSAAPDARVASTVGPIQTAATPPLDTAQRNDVTLLKPAAEVVRNVDEAPATGRSPLKWQTVERPSFAAGTDSRQGDFDRRRTGSNGTSAAVLDKRHRIRDGDTLRELARRYLGSEDRYLDLFEFNRDVLARPELLPIGAELRIPPLGFMRPNAADPPATSTAVAQTLPALESPPSSRGDPPQHAPPAIAQTPTQGYVVQPHDTLPFIARKLYGDISRQADLLAANRQQLRSAKDLRPGMTLVVPAPRKP